MENILEEVKIWKRWVTPIRLLYVAGNIKNYFLKKNRSTSTVNALLVSLKILIEN
jgi:hypothetical protein